MNVYNIYFESGDMYTCDGKEESDAIKELFMLYPDLAGKDVRKVELNSAYGHESTG